MAEFNPRDFLFENPYLTIDILEQNNLTKSNLFSLATLQGYHNISNNCKKAEIMELILNPKSKPNDASAKVEDSQINNEQLRLQIELCKAQTALEQLKHSNRHIANTSHNESSITNIDKYFKYVPRFDEKEVDNFFNNFEHIANLHSIDTNIWAALVQSKFTGKAAQVATRLDVTYSKNYEIVKETVLRSYALVPTAYQLKFRQMKKHFKQSWADFIWEKEDLCNKWFTAKNISSVEECKHLIVMEEIKNSMPSNINKYISESTPNTLTELAKMADEFELQQGQNTNVVDYYGLGELKQNRKRDYNERIERVIPTGNVYRQDRFKKNTGNVHTQELECWKCHARGHFARDCNK